MSEKEEALRQISEIKSHLVDKETFFPYNYNACHVWAIIAIILTLVTIPAYAFSITLGTGVMFVLITIGFIVERLLTKKVNASYELDECTKRQEFIMKNFLMITLFLIGLSTVLAMQELYVVIYVAWLFLISLGYFAVGFVLNIKDFTKMAQFNMITSLALLIVGAYFNILGDKETLFVTLTQAMVIFGLAIFPSWIAWKQQKREAQKEACSV
ncbi:MAG: hypothetical protein KAU90_00590 [Sulfurovaceae bacterium]|nr:hypothetical protein [Sulfurovaceae bacterium]